LITPRPPTPGTGEYLQPMHDDQRLGRGHAMMPSLRRVDFGGKFLNRNELTASYKAHNLSVGVDSKSGRSILPNLIAKLKKAAE
jgi:hypothetical protein